MSHVMNPGAGAATSRASDVKGGDPALGGIWAHDSLAARVVMGQGAIQCIGDEVARLQGTRVMLLTGKTGTGTRAAAQLASALGPLLVETCDDVVPHSGVGLVERLAERARRARIDLLLALGGGSASDTAKGVALLLAEGGPLARHATRFTPPDKLVSPPLCHPKLPIIAVPTTASAAEVTAGLGIRDEDGRKLLFLDPRLAARTVILDPGANLEVPAALMAATGMNALAHCVEGLYSTRRNPVSEALAREGIRLLARGLPAMVRAPSDIAARGDVMYGAHLSGMVLTNARPALHHALCHCLGARCGLSHGEANAIMLPHVMRWNKRAAAAQLRAVAEAFGMEVDGLDDDAAADAAVEAVCALQGKIGVATRLRDTTADRAALAAVADHAMGDRGLYFNPGPPLGQQEVLQVLQAAW